MQVSPSVLLRKQVQTAYKDSFRAKLTSEIDAGSAEGVIWLCTLHRELIIRLCSYLKRNTKIQDEIAEHCDPIIFKQLIENKCYKLEDLNGCMVECVEGKKKFSSLICDFIIKVHGDMDVLDGDFESKECKEFKAFLKSHGHDVPS